MRYLKWLQFGKEKIMGDSRKWAYEEEQAKRKRPDIHVDDGYMTVSKFADDGRKEWKLLSRGDMTTSEYGDEELDQHAHGAKLDQGKIDITLLQEFGRALHEVARVGDYGQHKYTRGGFLGVINGVKRYTRAMLDHWFKEYSEGTYDQDPWYDTEVGLRWKGMIRHDAQVAWNALARLEIKLREEEDGE